MPRDAVVAPIFDASIVLALVRARRGDPGYWPLLDEAHEIAVSVGDLQFIASDAESRAEVAWLEGRPDAIAHETEQAFALAVGLGEPSCIGSLACWRWRAGLLTEPPAGADELHRLQIAGDWERAAALWRECNDPYQAALALVDAKDPSALRQALDDFRALGANPAAAVAARRLRELGQRHIPRGPRPETRENPAGLTARELEVLPLLAEGLRNAEIAQRLVISHKTVDHHVSSILRKLGVNSRGQAAAAAGRLGVKPTARSSTSAPR
jgi:DNA-binding CsgD family transcriptional regulator